MALKAEELHIIRKLSEFKSSPVFKTKSEISYRFSGIDLFRGARLLHDKLHLTFVEENRRNHIGHVVASRDQIEEMEAAAGIEIQASNSAEQAA